MPTLKLTPVQTSRGVFLKAELDGVELERVWLTDGSPVELEIRVPKDLEAEAEKSRSNRRVARLNKEMSRSQEKHIAKDLNAREQIASGSLPGKKGDVFRDGLLRLEAKSTRAKSFSMTTDILHKAIREAKYGEIPAVVVHFYDGLVNTDSFAVCGYSTFVELLNAYCDHKRPSEKQSPGSRVRKDKSR